MKYFLLLLAALAAVDAVPSLPTNSKFCIEHCTCKFGPLSSRLQIINCDRPLVLNSTTFKYISKTLTNVISLENLIIDQIQESTFSEFKKLEDVVVRNTRIGSIDAKAFDNVTRLKFVDCGFEDSPDLFSIKLEEVHFGSCNLEEIPNLNGLISLTFLNLSGNYIKNIEIVAFAELFNLEELHLANNEVFRVPPTAFINNPDLLTLNLDNNPLKHFSINTSDSLEVLSLKNCSLETFDEDSTRKLTALNELTISHNNIKSISSKALAHMQEISIVDISYNKLTKLDEDSFSDSGRLIKLILDGNNFETLPSFYRKNGESFSVYTFSCKYCSLKTLPGTVFQNMEGLTNLELSHNKFMNIDNMFGKVSSLKLLDISYNNIAYISPAALINNKNLEVLNIAGNPLMVLNPEVFAGNHFLREIDARNASLTKLWSNYNKAIKSLHKLLIGNNQLGTLVTEDFTVMPKLEAIELHNNPLVFDNKLCGLFHFLELEGVTPLDYSKEIYSDADKAFREDIDGFVTIEWNEIHGGKCSQHLTGTHFADKDDTTKYVTKNYTYDENDNEDDDDDTDEYDDEYYNDDDDADEETSTKFLKEDSSLARATYILSITSVFVLSALVVLTVAVTVTLCVLRRNNRFDMHRANLPRLKIPLWNTTPGQKKHSGSVYKPLSEDLSGPKTPKLSRYEFTTTPVVHTA